MKMVAVSMIFIFALPFGLDSRSLPADTCQNSPAWIEQVLRRVAAIKEGSSRAELEQVFTTEGGLSTRTRRTYVYKENPYIKVDVDFAPDVSGDGSVENPKDRIIRISRPYLQLAIRD